MKWKTVSLISSVVYLSVFFRRNSAVCQLSINISTCQVISITAEWQREKERELSEGVCRWSPVVTSRTLTSETNTTRRVIGAILQSLFWWESVIASLLAANSFIGSCSQSVHSCCRWVIADTRFLYPLTFNRPLACPRRHCLHSPCAN